MLVAGCMPGMCLARGLEQLTWREQGGMRWPATASGKAAGGGDGFGGLEGGKMLVTQG
jgi:hypothetical protein